MKPKLSEVVYLGPPGSYTEQTLHQSFDCTRTESASSIASVIAMVASKKCAWGFVPLENVIEGPVVETIDELFACGAEVQIHSSVNAEIHHCLGAPENTPLTAITKVYSHQQALQQCSRFLEQHLPLAQRIASTSTAAAAQELTDAQAAVIASEETLRANKLQVLAKAIANTTGNRTRFALLRHTSSVENEIRTPESNKHLTSLAIDPGRDRQGILHEILEVISVKNRCNIVSIHSRPDRRGGFVFYLDIEGSLADPEVNAALSGLRLYCEEVTGKTASISILGSYPCRSFHSPAFTSVGIIGARGAMGGWFSTFFETLGLRVHGYDQGSEIPLETIVSKSDVILLSVPMSEMETISEQILPLLRPGQLVVENASIKNSSLPYFEDHLPPEVELLGIHTMFGAQTHSLREQNIIITKTRQSGATAQAFEDLLYKQGARLHAAEARQHDRASASLQAMLHLLLLSTGAALAKEWDSALALDAYSTPNSRAILDTLKRLSNQNKELLIDMQQLNPESEKMRHRLLSELANQVFALDHGSPAELEAALNAVRRFFAADS